MKYLIGDATRPRNLSALIVHVTNNKGGWGRGFVLALEGRFPGMGARWRKRKQKLGDVAIEKAAPFIAVAHCCAQDGYKSVDNPVPLDYDALVSCLQQVREWLLRPGNDSHCVVMPRIGTGLAGGDWKRIEPMIDRYLRGVDVYVYDLRPWKG